LKRQKIHSFLHPLVFLFQGLTRHLLVLKRLRMREWLSYISKKLDIVKEMIHQKDVYRGERSILYQDVVSAANYEAMARYSPKNYPGYLHIILASDRPIDSASDSRLDWTQLAEGGYSAYHINSSDSGLLFTEPSVHDLSQKITHILNEVDSPAEPVHESES